jgi:aflatoxin B1 aldehyde reductase
MPAASLAVAGVSSTAQVQSNLAALRDGPLPAPIVEAFEEAWKVARPACEPYFRGFAPT